MVERPLLQVKQVVVEEQVPQPKPTPQAVQTLAELKKPKGHALGVNKANTPGKVDVQIPVVVK